jgi:hypothetical protein
MVGHHNLYHSLYRGQLRPEASSLDDSPFLFAAWLSMSPSIRPLLAF